MTLDLIQSCFIVAICAAGNRMRERAARGQISVDMWPPLTRNLISARSKSRSTSSRCCGESLPENQRYDIRRAGRLEILFKWHLCFVPGQTDFSDQMFTKRHKITNETRGDRHGSFFRRSPSQIYVTCWYNSLYSAIKTVAISPYISRESRRMVQGYFYFLLCFRSFRLIAQYAQDYKRALTKLCELQVQVLDHWLAVDQVGTKQTPAHLQIRTVTAMRRIVF